MAGNPIDLLKFRVESTVFLLRFYEIKFNLISSIEVKVEAKNPTDLDYDSQEPLGTPDNLEDAIDQWREGFNQA